MRSSIRLFLVLLGLTFSFHIASANDTQLVLPDILSPEELVEELGLEDDASQFLESFNFSVIEPRLHIKVDKSLEGTSPTAQSLDIYLDGVLIQTLLVSTGREKTELAKSGRTYFSRTPTGTFKIYRRARNHFSVTWQAPMPFAQFFIGGIAIHATTPNYYKDLGKRASGGCIRVSMEHAELIWNLVEEVGVQNTRVTVYENKL